MNIHTSALTRPISYKISKSLVNVIVLCTILLNRLKINKSTFVENS